MIARRTFDTPAPTGSSVCFFVATPTNDEVLARAHRWADGIHEAAAGDGCVHSETLVTGAALRNRLLHIQEEVAGKTLGEAAKRVTGGLDSHTLVLVTRGLPEGSSSGGSAQGLLFSGVSGTGAHDVVLSQRHLGFMEFIPSLQGAGGRVQPRSSLRGQPSDFQAEVEEWARLFDFLRGSVYRALYLCACGGGRKLEGLASALSALTGLTLYFNRAPVYLEEVPDRGVRARVGAPAGGANLGLTFSGQRRIPLVSEVNAFLPGSEAREPSR